MSISLKRMATVGALCAAGLLAASGPATAAETKGKTFASPEEAVKALVAAAGDQKAVLAILGPEAKGIVSSGDAAADKADRERFLKSYGEANKLMKSGDDMALLVVGKDEWIFPIPIVKEKAGWRFDTKEGKEEVLNRRIGRNELSVIQAVQAYVDAQREYYLRNPQNDKLLQYAQRFISNKGKRDGLYFPVKAGEQASPLGPLFDRRQPAKKEEGTQRVPYHGYYYRILREQGPDARGGAYSYVAQGRMIGGHALVAWPASYGNSGIVTFIVNQDGVVYEKDLGRDTAAAAQKIARFNPDKSWKRLP
ncbi:MAG TPA: DUF2950 domain-containing protein [Burkholderiales bacterium]|nr:DUF2950 domain-containing protein [Burkholderiales bacterium]